MNFQFGLRESSDTFDVLALIMSHFFAISSTIHDGSDFFFFLELIYYITHSLLLCRFYAAGSISVSSSHISLLLVRCLSFAKHYFFSCVSHSPRSTASRCVGRSSPSFRRRPFVVYHLPISSPFRKQSNLIHRMWTRMFASMCFFFIHVKEPNNSTQQGSSAREQQQTQHTK